MRRIPESALRQRDAAVLMAVIRVAARDPAVKVRVVAAESGLPTTTAFESLQRLRRQGLVGWEDGRSGTLRPLVEVVPVLSSRPEST